MAVIRRRRGTDYTGETDARAAGAVDRSCGDFVTQFNSCKGCRQTFVAKTL